MTPCLQQEYLMLKGGGGTVLRGFSSSPGTSSFVLPGGDSLGEVPYTGIDEGVFLLPF